MTDARLLADVFTAGELTQLKGSCKAQILAGGASQAFVLSSSVGGRSVSLQKSYDAWEMLSLIETALAILAGQIGNSRATRATYGVY
jgi:hypothetical protein